MNAFFTKVLRFVTDEDGPTAVEYAVLLLVILLVCLTAIMAIGQLTANSLDDSYRSIDGAFDESF